MSDDAVYSMRVARHVNAPRSVVYRALLDADAIARWRVPDGMTSQVHEFDPREGGAFRVSLSYDAPGQAGKTESRTDTYHGHFARLIPDREVVELIEFETADAALAGAMTLTTTLTDTEDGGVGGAGDAGGAGGAGSGTEVLMVHEGIPASVPPADNETGTRMALTKLAALAEANSRR